MIANLQPYPEYKESGVTWLGGIPRHWNSGPGFAAFRERQVKNTGMQEKTVLSLSYGRIVVKPPEKHHHDGQAALWRFSTRGGARV